MNTCAYLLTYFVVGKLFIMFLVVGDEWCRSDEVDSASLSCS